MDARTEMELTGDNSTFVVVLDATSRGISMKEIATICFISISAVGTVGNSIAIYILFQSKHIRKCNCFMLLVNQSVADIASCVASFVWIVTDKYFPKSDMLGTVDWITCAFIHSQYFIAVTVFVSSYNLSVVSIERMFSIVFPVFHRLHFNKRNMKITIFFTWIFSTLMISSFSLPINGIRSNGDCYFWNKFTSLRISRIYSITVIGIFNIIPLSMMVISYAMIYYTLRVNNTRANLKSNVIKMVASCVLAYVVCHCMRSFMSIAARFNSRRFSMTGPFYMVTLVFVQSNSAINPIIYMFQYKDYRKELRKQIRRLVGIENVVSDSSYTSSETHLTTVPT